MGFAPATLAILKGIAYIAATTAAVTTVGTSLYQMSKASDAAESAQESQQAALSSLAPEMGPTDAELAAQTKADEERLAKEAAEKRAQELEAGIAEETEAAKKRRSLVGLAATVKTSAAGLTTRATVEKKSLLGEGGVY